MDKDDKKIAELLKRELPKERENPWFTQKVLNRLPPRRNNAAIIEKCAVLISTIGVLIGFVFQSIHMATAQVIYVRDMVMTGVLLIAFFGLAAWIIIPLARN